MSIDAAADAAAARSVLVVVPTLNEVRTIEAVLGSLTQDLPRRARVTLVVADGGSTDGTVQRVAAAAEAARHSGGPDIHLVHNPRRLQSAGINLAARRYGQAADVLVRCDAHAQYPQGFVRRLLDTLDRTQADSVVVPMDSSGTGCFQRAVAWVSNCWVGTGGAAHRGGQHSGFVDHGHHAAFRMQSFLRAGGYDESFSHNEDAELDCRQRRLGAKLYLDAQIRLAYQPRATVAALARQYFMYGLGRSRTGRRHPNSLRLRQLALPLNLALLVLTLALASWWSAALAYPLLYLGALLLTSAAIAWAHRSLCGLLAGPAAAVMHLAWALGFVVGLATSRETAWRPLSEPAAERAAKRAAGGATP